MSRAAAAAGACAALAGCALCGAAGVAWASSGGGHRSAHVGAPPLSVRPGASSASRSAHASAGRWMNIKEVGHLHRIGKGDRGLQLNEKGYATGTISGSIYIHLRVTAVNRASIQVNVYPRGGFLGGYAVAGYYARGAVAHFSGSMRINGGSGTYRGASGSNLRFSGTLNRSNDNATVTLSGRIHT